MNDDVNVKSQLIDSLKKFDNVMVTTRAQDGAMHSRPMAVAEVDDRGVVWFVTAKDSAKTHEVSTDARCSVTGQKDGIYVSLSGRLDVVNDRERVRSLWKEAWKVWFPEGKEDPNICLMRLTTEVGEYWDNRGANGVRYLFEAAKALLDGRPASPNDPKQHAKVAL